MTGSATCKGSIPNPSLVKPGKGRASGALFFLRHAFIFLPLTGLGLTKWEPKDAQSVVLAYHPTPHIFMRKEYIMLSWAITFLVIALIAGALGFGGIAGASAGMAQILFFIFIVLFVVAMIARAVRGRPPI